jgi:surface protein with Ig-like domain
VIHDLYVTIIHAQHVHSDDLCLKKSDGSEACITGDQLAAMEAAGAPNAGSSGGAPATIPATAEAAASGPAIIVINGENPANITVGATYVDLGAQITAPQADLNLGIHLYIDGAPTDAVQLDTTQPGTHSIDYVVTDAAGLTSTSTRAVIVSAPANDNQATSTPPAAANDSAAATTTATMPTAQ